ncbi:MAG: VOC family protein [Bacteroides sp.]
MTEPLKFHHIGYVTDNIVNTLSCYSKMGYLASEIVVDPIQKVRICFVSKNGDPCIELVEPLDEKSSVNKILKKNGVSPYHVCYEVENIHNAFENLIEDGFIPLFRPVEATAMDNRLICYLYKKEIGFIELLNK